MFRNKREEFKYMVHMETGLPIEELSGDHISEMGGVLGLFRKLFWKNRRCASKAIMEISDLVDAKQEMEDQKNTQIQTQGKTQKANAPRRKWPRGLFS